jgi:hypothetical protein
MSAFFFSVFFALRAGFRTRAALQTEVIALRHHLLVLGVPTVADAFVCVRLTGYCGFGSRVYGLAGDPPW